MIYRLLIFSLQLIIILAIVSLLFSNPFIISLDIGNFKYSFSSNIFVTVFLLILLFLYISFLIFFKSQLSIRSYFIKNKYKKLEKGYHYFIEAMIAVANKDNKSAIKFHKKMNSYLVNDEALSLLLKSEVYKIERKQPELAEVYEKMLKSKKLRV